MTLPTYAPYIIHGAGQTYTLNWTSTQPTQTSLRVTSWPDELVRAFAKLHDAAVELQKAWQT